MVLRDMRWTGLDETELRELARALGAELTPGDVITLVGPMGAGKTTFTRALAEGLGVSRPDRVCSPTFNICLVHAGPIPLVHIDLFRLGASEGLEDNSPAFGALGLEDLLERASESTPVSCSGGVVVIEWADLWSARVTDTLEIQFTRPSGQALTRDLAVATHGPRAVALRDRWVNGARTRPPIS